MAQIAAAVPAVRTTAQLELAGLAAPIPDAAARPAVGQGSSSNDLGFELGFDHARHGVTPPVAHLSHQSPLLQGWQAGMATFGRRAHKPNRHTRLWLQLRVHAWQRGRSFEDVQLTPNYLQQIAADFCPILRSPLSEQQGSVDRVRDDAGYAAGNLAMMSPGANAAKARHGWASASELARSVAQGPIRSIAGLGPQEWRRVAVLCSFVTELPHEEAAVIPLHVLPPNRLRLFNPIQALQALVTRQLATPGWSARLARLEALLPNEALRADFNRFVLALAPRVLHVGKGALTETHEIRWALEDAWAQPLVQKRWAKFALQLNAAQAEALVQRAAAKRLCPVHVQRHPEPRATEGWALERGGYRAPAH
ncbi:hypothetical protein G8A07_00470 [Roseateles sp. DAIF2]|uniref:hypothetical protein n=1 Tax=Roseateles sp. DAIF2 TaxID=2714952 RepID=UPI0018A29C3D|nr:hypothetical protein [Roseateles sp. DAIF2]QPF71542.1 hypothetical protein G8A07_00470 [Roseateles sp. DAIF2]